MLGGWTGANRNSHLTMPRLHRQLRLPLRGLRPAPKRSFIDALRRVSGFMACGTCAMRLQRTT